ncbi:MAG TPA: DNA internalization-related competence protein ComEC/Rec2, partial [Steroidobacteraceae bacterium]
MSADVPGAFWQAGAATLLGSWIVSPWRGHPRCVLPAMLLAGMLLATLHAGHWMHRALPSAGRVLAEGRIASVPERQGETLVFDLRTDVLEGVADSTTTRLLRVRWRDPHAAPRVGERWRLLLRLTAMEETRNLAGFDRARLAFRAGVHGTGRVLPSNLNGLLALAPAGLDTVRARIGVRVRDAIADPDAAALVTALAVGITAGMSRDQWRVFSATGTTHLVAISGLHVTLFAWLAFRAGRLAWRVIPGHGRVPREPFALLLGLAAAGGYALLAGFSVPTQRTWLMLALYVGARLMARRVDAGQLWSMALVLVLLTDARAPLAAGFWLSFIAVGVLLAFARDDSAGAAGAMRWRSAVRVQLTIMLALAPASLAIFGGLSFVGLAVNLAAIPVISLVFVPVVLAGALVSWLAPAVDAPLFALAARLYDTLWPALAWCADLEAPQALWRAAPSGWWFVCALPASLVWLCRWPWPLRLTACCALLPLVFIPARGPEAASARLSVLDAGRGAAVLVRTSGHALLFDTGDSWNTRGARLAEVVLPAMDAVELRRIDRLVLPALDDDRARAAALLALERGLGEAWSGRPWPGNGLAVRCRDVAWGWDGVRFEVYSQGGHCVLRIAVGRAAMLLSGELDADAERRLLARLGAGRLASDAVLIGRQASESASSPQWIGTIAPGLAVATGGVDGAQSRQRVLDRWRGGAHVLDTRRDGGIELSLTSRGVSVVAVARTARFPFHWRRSGDDQFRFGYSPEHVGNREKRRHLHGADHPL